MSGSEIVCLAASAMTVALAGVAIWLSVRFFQMSSAVSENTKEAARDVGAAVGRMEKLFESLYSDTFSMMRDTVTDMRKHMWPDAIQGGEEVNADALRTGVIGELALLERQGLVATVGGVVREVSWKLNAKPGEVLGQLLTMRKEGVVLWEEEVVKPDSVVKLVGGD